MWRKNVYRVWWKAICGGSRRQTGGQVHFGLPFWVAVCVDCKEKCLQFSFLWYNIYGKFLYYFQRRKTCPWYSLDVDILALVILPQPEIQTRFFRQCCQKLIIEHQFKCSTQECTLIKYSLLCGIIFFILKNDCALGICERLFSCTLLYIRVNIQSTPGNKVHR